MARQDVTSRSDVRVDRQKGEICTTNSSYFVCVKHQSIIVQDVGSPECVAWTLPLYDVFQSRILALSDADPEHLAVACRSTVTVYNIEQKRLVAISHGLNRAITALAWSARDLRLAIGCIDGSVFTWDIKASQRVLAQTRSRHGAVRYMSWSSDRRDTIAVAAEQELWLWIGQTHSHVLTLFTREEDQISYLAWNPQHTATLLTASVGGTLTIIDVDRVVEALSLRSPDHYELPTRLARHRLPTSSLSMVSQADSLPHIVSLGWYDESSVLILYNNGHRLVRLDVRNHKFGHDETKYKSDTRMAATTVPRYAERQYILLASSEERRCLDANLIEDNLGAKSLQQDQNVKSKTRKNSPRMSLKTIAQLKHQKSQPWSDRQSRNPSNQVSETIAPTRIEPQHQNAAIRPSSASTQATVISLATPTIPILDNDSPMPFLSPAIPARRPPSPTIDSIALPEAHSDSYFGSFSTVATHDSDSEDDAYGESNVSKKTMMPGGVNVPLPRSCGAVFNTSGHLVCFGPKKQSKSTKRLDLLEELKLSAAHNELIFPTFGNLMAELEITEVLGHETYKNEPLQEMLGLGTSFNSNESWKPRSLSIAAPVTSTSATRVSVQSLPFIQTNEVEAASLYTALLQDGQSSVQMCQANQTIASRLNRNDDVILWQLLGRILEISDPPTSIQDRRPFQSRALWADHPLGSRWLVKQMISLAESRGNLLMLAYMSVVLIGASLPYQHQSLGVLMKRLPVMTASPSQDKSAISPRMYAPTIVTSFSGTTISDSSPPKANRSSTFSSRNPSQPTTPHLESSSSTPPWSLPSLGQSASRTSLSNSVSPDTTRHSFSAAVKSYAQSVSDKFASYGTSPPIRKTGTSPNNELSSSFQSSSSLPKSVSFVKSQSSGFGRTSMDVDDGYDSDRTIEDASTPVTPREPRLGIKIIKKNTQQFANDGDEQFSTPLVPTELLPRCQIWIHAFAERLQSWNLDITAVQFGKIAGAIAEVLSPAESEKHYVSQPRSREMQCGICLCLINGLEHICPSCQHESHFMCIEEIIDRESGEAFECPAGCGCVCSISSNV